MTIRNIRKNLAGMEDLLQGVGVETQVRGNSSYNVGKVDVPYAVQSEAALKDLNVNVFTRARVYSAAAHYLDYVYDPDDLTGIVPNDGAGTWKLVSTLIASSAELTDLGSDVNVYSKHTGKQVWDSDSLVPVWAAGDTPSAVWVYADGATAQTPV